jgi:hypothetical protein
MRRPMTEADRFTMDDGADKPANAAPVFVASCVIGFLIIAGCVAYFIAKSFL